MTDGIAIAAQAGTVTREALEMFRTKQPDCVLALWVDIEARVVLAVDSDLRYPQEGLDTMCNTARHVLSVPPSNYDAAPDSVTFADPTGNHFILRDVNRPTHALICNSPLGLGSDRLLQAMKDFLSASATMDPVP